MIYVRRLLGLVHAVSEEAGYFGSWALAVGATGLRGLAAHDMHQYRAQFFEDDIYARTSLASYADLLERPGTISDQLLGRFLRKLGTYARYTQQLSNPTPNDSPTRRDESYLIEPDRG